jgi:O-antigen ligase
MRHIIKLTNGNIGLPVILTIFFMFAYLGFFNSNNMRIAGVLLVVFVGIAIYRGKFIIIRTNFSISCYVLLVLGIASAIFLNRATGYKYVTLIILGIFVQNYPFKKNEYELATKAIDIISTIFAVYTIINIFIPEMTINFFGFMLSDLQVDSIHRYFSYNHGSPGLAGELSYNAICMMLGFSVCLAKILSERRIRLWVAARIILLFYAIFLTTKRSILLIALLFLFVTLLFLQREYKHVKSWKRIIICGIIIILLLFIPVAYNFIKYEILYEGGKAIQLSGRQILWKIALDMFHSSPIIGKGINSYDIHYCKSIGLSYTTFTGAHNSYLQYMAETGIIGLIALIYMVFTNIIYTFRCINNNSFFAYFSFFGQLLFILYGFSGNPFYQAQELFTYFFLISFNVFFFRNEISKSYTFRRSLPIVLTR